MGTRDPKRKRCEKAAWKLAIQCYSPGKRLDLALLNVAAGSVHVGGDYKETNHLVSTWHDLSAALDPYLEPCWSCRYPSLWRKHHLVRSNCQLRNRRSICRAFISVADLGKSIRRHVRREHIHGLCLQYRLDSSCLAQIRSSANTSLSGS
jgi:hypothetical protein